VQGSAELIQRKARNASRAGQSGARGVPEAECAGTFAQRPPQDGSVRFAALAEKSADAAVKRLDTHFIDQFGEPPDI